MGAIRDGESFRYSQFTHVDGTCVYGDGHTHDQAEATITFARALSTPLGGGKSDVYIIVEKDLGYRDVHSVRTFHCRHRTKYGP